MEHSSVVVEAEDTGRVIAQLTSQRDLLETRYMDLLQPRSVPQITGFPRPTSSLGSARRSNYGKTPRQQPGQPGQEVAVRRLERELEIETKRREAAEREIHRLRLLNDRSRLTKRLTPRLHEPSVPAGVEQRNRLTPRLFEPVQAEQRKPIMRARGMAEIDQIAEQLRGAMKQLSEIKFPDNKENR